MKEKCRRAAGLEDQSGSKTLPNPWKVSGNWANQPGYYATHKARHLLTGAPTSISTLYLKPIDRLRDKIDKSLRRGKKLRK